MEKYSQFRDRGKTKSEPFQIKLLTLYRIRIWNCSLFSNFQPRFYNLFAISRFPPSCPPTNPPFCHPGLFCHTPMATNWIFGKKGIFVAHSWSTRDLVDWSPNWRGQERVYSNLVKLNNSSNTFLQLLGKTPQSTTTPTVIRDRLFIYFTNWPPLPCSHIWPNFHSLVSNHSTRSPNIPIPSYTTRISTSSASSAIVDWSDRSGNSHQTPSQSTHSGLPGMLDNKWTRDPSIQPLATNYASYIKDLPHQSTVHASGHYNPNPRVVFDFPLEFAHQTYTLHPRKNSRKRDKSWAGKPTKASYPKLAWDKTWWRYQ